MNLIDITKVQNRNKQHFLTSDAVIIAIPVYEDKIPIVIATLLS